MALDWTTPDDGRTWEGRHAQIPGTFRLVRVTASGGKNQMAPLTSWATDHDPHLRCVEQYGLSEPNVDPAKKLVEEWAAEVARKYSQRRADSRMEAV
jgi:hypothetical protein